MAGAADAKQVKRTSHPSQTHATQARAKVMTRDEYPNARLNERSFLDPGPVNAPNGNEQAYMTSNTYFNTTPDQNFARSKFGNEALPRALEVPGDDRPIFRFDTPSYQY